MEYRWRLRLECDQILEAILMLTQLHRLNQSDAIGRANHSLKLARNRAAEMDCLVQVESPGSSREIGHRRVTDINQGNINCIGVGEGAETGCRQGKFRLGDRGSVSTRQRDLVTCRASHVTTTNGENSIRLVIFQESTDRTIGMSSDRVPVAQEQIRNR